jgi:hypothetical protein
MNINWWFKPQKIKEEPVVVKPAEPTHASYSDAVTLAETGPVAVKKMGDVFVAAAAGYTVRAPSLAVAVEELAKTIYEANKSDFI